MAAWTPSPRQLCKTITTRPKSKAKFERLKSWANRSSFHAVAHRRPAGALFTPRTHSNLSLSNLLPSRVQLTHSRGLMTGHDTIGTPCKYQQFVAGAKGKAKHAAAARFCSCMCVCSTLRGALFGEKWAHERCAPPHNAQRNTPIKNFRLVKDTHCSCSWTISREIIPLLN